MDDEYGSEPYFDEALGKLIKEERIVDGNKF